MQKKGVKCPLGWTLVDENIENVEHITLDPDVQRELGCIVGKHVFLEYPWAFVPRQSLLKFSRISDSALADFRQRIETYEAPTFLIGYASTELSSCDFLICLTEEAKLAVMRRNRQITKTIVKKALSTINKIAKYPKTVGSELKIDEERIEKTRERFQIEVSLPPRISASEPRLEDSKSSRISVNDSIHLVNKVGEDFLNVRRKCISKTIQTHREPRQNEMQTFPGYPRNSWTHYEYEGISEDQSDSETKDGESSVKPDDERSDRKAQLEEVRASDDKDDASTDEEEKSREKTSLDFFLEDHFEEVTDIVKYNALMNLHVDDIQSLAQKTVEKNIPICQILNETNQEPQLAFVSFCVTTGKSISEASWLSGLDDHVAISYMKAECPEIINNSAEELESGVFIWSLKNPLQPKLRLLDHRQIYSVSCCPYTNSIIVGGCDTGQVILWNIKNHLTVNYDNEKGCEDSTESEVSVEESVPVVQPLVVSCVQHSHRLPVRKIRWMPANYRIEPNGKLTKLSAIASRQFLTASEDGTIAVWDFPLDINPNDLDHPNYQAIYKFTICIQDESSTLSIYCFTMPSVSILHEKNPSLQENEQQGEQVNFNEQEYIRSLWIGTVKGLVRCTWEGQMFDEETSGGEVCKVLNHSYIHDGPVKEILRSPHLRDVLLTIGGHIFAIWKDDFIETPLFWRKSQNLYSSCSWTNTPGVFLIGRHDGVVEIWDIKGNSSGPIFQQSLSRKSITHLILSVPSNQETSGVIGAGDSAGVFRIFKEPSETNLGETLITRLDWFEEYIWREVRRKRFFLSWQIDYLANDPGVLARKQEEEELNRRKKQEEARELLQREHQERLRLEEERKARCAPKSKDVIRKSKDFSRMKNVLLKKKDLDPKDLEEKRLPLVIAETERQLKLSKVQDLVKLQNQYFEHAVTIEFPELINQYEKDPDEPKLSVPEKCLTDYMQEYEEIRNHARKMLNSYSPDFNPSSTETVEQKALGIICMACASPAYLGATHWFLLVVVTAFIATLIWCSVYFLSIREALKLPINWILSELINTAVETVLYMIAFIAQLSVWTAFSGAHTSANIAAGVFGIFNTLAYAAGTYFLYIEWKSSNTQ